MYSRAYLALLVLGTDPVWILGPIIVPVCPETEMEKADMAVGKHSAWNTLLWLKYMSFTLNCLWLQTVTAAGCAMLWGLTTGQITTAHLWALGIAWTTKKSLTLCPKGWVLCALRDGFLSSETSSHWKPGFCRVGCLSVGRACLFDLVFQLIFAVDRLLTWRKGVWWC